MVHMLHITTGGQTLFFMYSVIFYSCFMDVNDFGVQSGNDDDYSSLPLLDIGIPHWGLGNVDLFLSFTLFKTVFSNAPH